MIGIVNYGVGNIKALVNQYEILNIKHIVINEKEQFNKVEKIILPGVGSFDYCKTQLENSKLIDALNENVCVLNKPVLGICVGMQLMANHSEEGDIQGLGWIDSKVVKFKMNDKLRYKVPHIGWNSTYIEKKSPLFDGISNDSMFYFVHSFHINCHNKEDILTTSNYEYSFSSAIQRDNIYGTQFHPEKSHDLGEQLLKNFLNI